MLSEAELHDLVQARQARHWWYRARRDLLFDVVRRWQPRDSRFLEVGCGNGWVLEQLAGWCVAWGVEPLPEAVAACRQRGLQVVQGGVEALDDPAAAGLPDGFDGLAFFDVLEHLDDDLGALRSARRVLGPGGRLFVTVPAYGWLWSQHDRLHRHRRRYTRCRVGALLHEAGFALDVLTYFNALLLPAAAVTRLLAREGAGPGVDLAVPPRWLNLALEHTLRAERPVLARASTRFGFPAGLSILAVGRQDG